MITKSRGSFVTTNLSGYSKQFLWNQPSKPNGWLLASETTRNWPMVNGKVETITFDNSKRKGKLKTTRYCHHVTAETYCVPNVESHYYPSDQSTIRYIELVCKGETPTMLTVPAVSLPHLEALQFFEAGCTKTEFSLPVNLAELKQLPSLFSDFPRFFSSLTRDLKSKIKTGASAHLWYQFGVKPLIGDIKAACALLTNLDQKISWLRENSGKPVRVRFTKDMSTALRPETTTWTDPSGHGHYKCDDYSCIYKAHGVLVYDLSRLSDLELKIRYLLVGSGFDRPLEVAWELIPYSFVVDWFLKVGDLLATIGPKITFPYKALDVGWSIKIRASFIDEAFRDKPYKDDGYQFYKRTTKTLYHREAGLPISFSVLAGEPGLQQLALALSLGLQKL